MNPRQDNVARNRGIRINPAGFSELPRGACRTVRADEAVRPAPFEQERNAARFVRKCLLEFGKRARPDHRVYVLATSRGRPHGTLHLERPESTG